MSGKRSRNKGRDYQSQVARTLSRALVRPFRSTQGSEVRDGARGDVCEDQRRLEVDGRPLLPLPLVIECKKGKQPSIKAALRQVQEEAEGHPDVYKPIGFPQVGRPWPVVFTHYDAPAPFQQVAERFLG